MGKLYYFAHPLTARDSCGNRSEEREYLNYLNSLQRTAKLLSLGYNVISPIPHSYKINEELKKLRIEDYGWYSLDNEMIEKTNFNGIILAPNWESSFGCREEKKKFEEKGLEVLLYEDIVKDN